MGLGLFKASGCSCGNEPVRTVERVVEKVVAVEVTQVPKGNPDPTQFTVIRAVADKGNVVAMVRYPDAKNYEGLKILVYEGTTPNDLRTAQFLDPHFCESNAHISPVARFAPTPEGWRRAVLFMRSL